jgi:hypothetical protein
VIDNGGNGGAFTSSCEPDLEFCDPVSSRALTSGSCDRMDWLAHEFIVAAPHAAVSAQWGVGDQTDDGYQFWFFSPVGGYNRRILHSHAVSMGYGPANETRACHLPLNFTPVPLPFSTLLNVRVRTLVNGSYGDFGPACRFMLLSAPSACPTTQLVPTPGSTFSCGATGKMVGASGAAGKLWATPVGSATHYRFRLEVPSEAYLRQVTVSGYVLTLGAWTSNPLLCGSYTYDVSVAISTDGGATFCPFGTVCAVGITNGPPKPCTSPGGGSMAPATANLRTLTADDTRPLLHPNPNDGQHLSIDLSWTLDGRAILRIFSATGQVVIDRPIGAHGANAAIVGLGDLVDGGVFLVEVSDGERSRKERLVIQP